MKFTIEVSLNGALVTKRYEALFNRLLTQRTPLTFHQLIMLIPSIRFHKFNIQSSEVNMHGSDEELGKVTAVVNLKNVD